MPDIDFGDAATFVRRLCMYNVENAGIRRLRIANPFRSDVFASTFRFRLDPQTLSAMFRQHRDVRMFPIYWVGGFIV